MHKFNSYHKYFLSIPILILILGISVMWGWSVENKTLIQLSPQFMPMPFNTALNLCLLALSLIFAIVNKPRITNILSGFVILFSILTLIEYLFNANIGIDQLFMEHYITTKSAYPGRMAANTTICFLFASIMLLITTHIRYFSYSKFAYTALVMSFINIGISSVALIGYIFHSDAYGCTASECMALHTAIGIFLWNIGFIAWFKTTVTQSITKQNIIVTSIVFIGIIFTFLFVSQLLTKKEQKELIETKTGFDERVQKSLREVVKLKAQAIELIALRLELQNKITEENWTKETSLHLNDYDSVEDLVLFNKDFNKIYEKNINHLTNIRYPAYNEFKAVNSSSPYLSNPVETSQFDYSFWILVPVVDKNQKIIYYVGALMSYDKIFEVLVSNKTKSSFRVGLVQDNQLVYRNYIGPQTINNQLSKTSAVEIYNKILQLTIEPTQLFVSRYITLIPQIILIIGIILSFLVYQLASILISIQNKSKQLQLVLNGTKSILESSSLDQAIKSCLSNICEIMNWDVGHAYFVSKKDKGKLIPSNIWYVNDYRRHHRFCTLTRASELTCGECLPGKVLQKGEAVWMDNVKKDSNFLRAPKDGVLNIKSAFGLPIKIHNSVIMVLEFFNDKTIPYDRSLMKTIEVLSENLSKAYAKREMEDLLTKKTIELEAFNKEMQSLAYKDPLTRLLNRRAFEEEASRVLSYAKRHDITTAIIYSDLDNFKNINDQFGHETGDLLLLAVAEIIQDLTRKEDLVARFGGDEFVIFLSHLNNANEAQKIAQKIINRISQPLIINGNTLYPSISIGIKICNTKDELSDAIRSADKALYQSKSDGKSCANMG